MPKMFKHTESHTGVGEIYLWSLDATQVEKFKQSNERVDTVLGSDVKFAEPPIAENYLAWVRLALINQAEGGLEHTCLTRKLGLAPWNKDGPVDNSDNVRESDNQIVENTEEVLVLGVAV
jgi:hypothetical protein